ncbi:MAG: PIG-L deacetylase family protein [Acidimicrobiales bacterium]
MGAIVTTALGTPRGPVSVDLPVPSRALAIAAHPDDVEFGCGATLAKWAAAGCEVSHLILTDGSKGTWDEHADTVALAAERQVEQRAAAAALGATGEVVMLGVVDGDLQATLDRREEVARWIRRLRPDVVLGHDPWKRYRLHPDHRHAGWLTVDGVVAARDPHFHPDHEVPHHRPSALLLFEADEPNHVEDVGGHVDTKIAALLEHRSQLRSTMFIDEDDDGTQLAAFRQRVLDRLAAMGAMAGVAQGEAFHALTDL